MTANARVYEPLRCQSALLSSYHTATKWGNVRKPAASNGLYTLLANVLFLLFYSCNKFKPGISIKNYVIENATQESMKNTKWNNIALVQK
jgi:hypothetical protein